MFKEYSYGCWKKEIRDLIKKRANAKDRIRYHQKKIEHHETKIKEIQNDVLKNVEADLDKYLKRAGNT